VNFDWHHSPAVGHAGRDVVDRVRVLGRDRHEVIRRRASPLPYAALEIELHLGGLRTDFCWVIHDRTIKSATVLLLRNPSLPQFCLLFVTDRGLNEVSMSSDGATPPAAAAWGSLLSTPDFAAITSVGFYPVGPVLGVAVVHLGYVNRVGRCSGGGSRIARTDLASTESGPFNLLLRKRQGVRRQVLARAIEECEALGGDGIVGMRLTIKPFPAGGTEFSVQGTAVRARTDVRPASPFSSQLSPQEFARLLRAGWVPTDLVFGVAVGARHDDQRTRSQTRRTAVGEIRGYSELVKDTRRDARSQLEKAVADTGADGVVVSDMTLQIGERECPTQEGAHDHVAEAAMVGTAIAAVARLPGLDGQAPLTILHLNDGVIVTANLRPDNAPPPPARPESEGGLADRLSSAWDARRAARNFLSGSDSAGIPKKAD
jgi:uncharacterized protein YbjQ (UPF0145 family)